jgi:diadenosine tetraphosphate (Ap4A) HIT family hydrolase
MENCLACDLTAGRRILPGGCIYASRHWVVEHCIGPLPVGTLICKPRRHCEHVWELTTEEAGELGPLLFLATRVINQLSQPDQVYVCLWSHAGWQPGHIHFVLQPVWRSQSEQHTYPGPMLQVELFTANQAPPPDEVASYADKARVLFASSGVD